MPEEIPRVCATCGQDESDCPTRSGCFTPKYKNWIETGIEKESAFCSKCGHWRAVKIGLYCPDCGQTL